MKKRRLLCLEFLVVERCRNDSSHYLPFYVGMARAAGARVDWLAYGCDFEMSKGGYFVDLPPEDLASLTKELRRLKPTHIISSEALSLRTFLALAKDAPEAEYVSLRSDLLAPEHVLRHKLQWYAEAFSAEGKGARGCWSFAAGIVPCPAPGYVCKCGSRPNESKMWKLQSLQAGFLPFPWMGAELKARKPAAPPPTLTDVRPDYDARIMNKSGEDLRSFVRVIGGHHCTSTVPLAGNPFLKGIDLGRYPSPVGCTYCAVTARGDREVEQPRDPVEQALVQLRRVVECVGTRGRNATEYDIYNTQVFLQAGRFFDRLLKMDFPPGAFYFSPRIDDFLKMWDELNRLMPRLQRAGHSVHILRMGIENFSPAEQGRFNKGISTAQDIEGYFKLKDLKTRFPKTFFVKGFGFIMFTPWTTLADVRFNLALARVIGFNVCGHMLTSTLQMDAGTPVVFAAQRDGLALPEPDDVSKFYDTWRTRAYRQNQTFFKFRDHRVDALFRALVRVVAHIDRQLFGPFFPEDDADFRSAVRFVEGLPEKERDYLCPAETLAEAARGLPAGAGAAELLERARQLSAEPRWRGRLGLVRLPWWLDPAEEGVLQRPKSNPFGPPPAPDAAQPAPAAPPQATQPRTPIGALLHERLPQLLSVLTRLQKLASPPLPGWELQTLTEETRDGFYGVSGTWRKDAQSLTVRILPADQEGSPHLCRCGAVELCYDGPSTLSPDLAEGLPRLCLLVDQYLRKARKGRRQTAKT